MDYCRRINMITAKEAYDKAENKRNEVKEEVKEMEMRDIENTITLACSNGFYRCAIDYAISNEAIEKLKTNGYEVTIVTPKRVDGKTETRISWENII